MNDVGKWTSVKQAFSNFMSANTVQNVGMGLAFFGVDGNGQNCPPNCNTMQCLQGCGCSSVSCSNNVCKCLAWGESCAEADYEKPVVEIAPLPGVASQIDQAFAATSPNGGTPSAPALQGAITHAKSWGTAKNHRVVVLMATDGQPEGCTNNTVQDVANVATNGVKQGVLTFVIGVGSDLAALNAVAAAGGTQQAFIVDTNGNIGQQFSDALKKIQQSASLACVYQIPPPQGGGTIDPSKVNVKVTHGNPPQTDIIPQVPDAAHCGTTGGWYYDNPQNPTQIIMCPSTCADLQGFTTGEVDVLLGCKTVVR
jgi:hypothetical protein